MTDTAPVEVTQELLPCPNPWCTARCRPLPCALKREGWRVRCECGVASFRFDTEAEAIRAWNTRTAAEQSCAGLGLVKQLRTAADRIRERDADAASYLDEAIDALRTSQPTPAEGLATQCSGDTQLADELEAKLIPWKQLHEGEQDVEAGELETEINAWFWGNTDRILTALRTTHSQRAAADVIAERERQVSVEGWNPAHDDEHAGTQLAGAAACYALASVAHWAAGPAIQQFWPWDQTWWKPSDARRNLVKAGALILAEIERLDRIDSHLGEMK